MWCFFMVVFLIFLFVLFLLFKTIRTQVIFETGFAAVVAAFSAAMQTLMTKRFIAGRTI